MKVFPLTPSAAVLEIGPQIVLESDTTLSAARNIGRGIVNYNAQSYILTLPIEGNEPGDVLVISTGTLQATQLVRRENTSGAPFTNLVTLTSGSKYTFRNSTGLKSGWELVPLDTHGHPITQVEGLQAALDEKAAAGNYLTPATLATDYFDRVGNATSRPPYAGQAPHQVVLSNDTRLIDARPVNWLFPAPVSPIIATGVSAPTPPEPGSMSYDGNYLYMVVPLGNQSLRWARMPMSINW